MIFTTLMNDGVVLSLYDTPMEIIIASVLLYRLLGISAFAGALFLLLGWPLNSYLSRRSLRIHKGLLKAKDARMGILTELISAVKIIKVCRCRYLTLS